MKHTNIMRMVQLVTNDAVIVSRLVVERSVVDDMCVALYTH